MERTKYNVNKNKEERTYNGIVFDSKMEMQYYRDVLCPKVESGEVTKCELQKKFKLQSGFLRNGKKIRAITYVADFYVEYADGRIEIIDIKGVPDTAAKIKRKMFWLKYPNMDYKWITYLEKFGGWVDYETAKALRREEKRERLKEDSTNGEE